MLGVKPKVEEKNMDVLAKVMILKSNLRVKNH